MNGFNPKLRNDNLAWGMSIRFGLKIWRRNFRQFRRSLVLSLVWTVLEPSLVLTAMVFGLGAFVSKVEGVSYAEFYFPALLCISSMLIAFFAATYDNFSKLTYQNIFSTQILAQIEPREIVLGEILWAASKGTISAIGVAVIGAVFGLVDSWRILPALGFVFISSLLFAAFGFWIAMVVRNYDQIIFPTSGLVIPMSLFCGTYFPIDRLPYGLNYALYAFPLTHAVRAVRHVLVGGFDWWMILNMSYILIIFLIFVRAGHRRLTSQLLD